jgi:hypothetical protein
MTFRELVIRFPSLSWHHTYIVFINKHSHNTNTQYTCPQYYISIFIHLHYIILTYSWVCILVLVSLSTRVYTRVLNNNFTQLVLSFIRSSCDFTTQHPHKKEYHIIYSWHCIYMFAHPHPCSITIFIISLYKKCRMTNIQHNT